MATSRSSKADLLEEIKNLGQRIKELEARRTGVSDDIDNKTPEEELISDDIYLQSIFRAAPTGIGVLSNRIFMQVNDRFCEMLGYTPSELIGKKARFVYPSDKECEYVGEEKYRQIKEKGTGTVETKMKCKDGEVIDVLLSSAPLSPDNLEGGVTFTALDITESKRVERALKRSRARFQQLIDEAPYTIMTSDRKGIIQTYNNEAALLSGYTSDEIIGRHFSRLGFLRSKDIPRYIKLFNSLLKGDQPEPFVMEYNPKNGSTRYAEIRVRSLEDDGKNIGFLVFGSDITEKRQALLEIESHDQLNQILLDTLPCVAMLLKPSTREIVASNKAGREVGAIPGKHCYDTWGQREDSCPWCLAPDVWADSIAPGLTIMRFPLLSTYSFGVVQISSLIYTPGSSGHCSDSGQSLGFTST